MNWKIKALIQKSIAYLSEDIAQQIYFKLQYRFGNASPSSLYDTKKAFFFLDHTRRQFGNTHQTYLEVGSGWTLFLPMALWLGGAKRVITIDLHRYVKPILVKEYIEYWKKNYDYLEKEFSRFTPTSEFSKRFDLLYECRGDINAIYDLANIDYTAPGDAASTGLADSSIDVHLSTNVLEHIPENTILDILEEAYRVLKPGGLLLHRINPGDHFEHADSSISSIHFLQFDQKTWDWWAGNPFAYHNRLRADDLILLFKKADFEPNIVEQVVDEKAVSLIKNGFRVDPTFAHHSTEDLATLGLILKDIR